AAHPHGRQAHQRDTNQPSDHGSIPQVRRAMKPRAENPPTALPLSLHDRSDPRDTPAAQGGFRWVGQAKRRPPRSATTSFSSSRLGQAKPPSSGPLRIPNPKSKIENPKSQADGQTTS